jgi:hypothetical protein
MRWTERIVEATRWHGDPDDTGWEQVETALGTALPADFKELCRRFGPGAFSAYLTLFRPDDEDGSMPLLDSLRFLQDKTRQDEAIARMYEPYGIFDPEKGSGLIQWGLDQTEGDYFWLADRSVDPDRWPVIARSEGSEPWDRFDMPTAEVVYRVIADPQFKPYTTADPPRRAFYLPRGQTISSAEEWDALTNPDRDR